jgi:hypothetical protein
MANRGEIIYRDHNLVFRLDVDGEGYAIMVHRVEEGDELLPRAYMMGHNYLKYKLKKGDT